MAERLEPGEIQASVKSVLQFARGETRLPTEDPQLGEHYFEGIKRYYELCQEALTNPAIVGLIRNYGIGYGSYTLDRPGINAVATEDMRVIAQADIFSNAEAVSVDVEKVTPQLHFIQEAQYSIARSTDETKLAWQQELIERCPAPQGGEEWELRSGTTANRKFPYLLATRPLYAQDLFNARRLSTFIFGVGNTFRKVQQSTLRQHTGFLEEARIREVAQAFGQANAILDLALHGKPLHLRAAQH